MALEAVVFPQDPLFGYNNCKDFSSIQPWCHEYVVQEELGIKADPRSNLDHHHHHRSSYRMAEEQSLHPSWDSSSSSVVMQNIKEWESTYNSSPENCTGIISPSPTTQPQAMIRRKRRRTRTCKNKEEVENQRMTHIAVERNRRKQMNEYLAVLRSLMPSSYVQRADQASIIGGAINFVKELEQLLQTLEVQSNRSKHQDQQETNNLSSPFAEFFTFPQYSTLTTTQQAANEKVDENQRPAVADIEVTMVESHANLKILSRRYPGQLLKMVAGFQMLGLAILHLNVSTHDHMVLYTISAKIEDGSQLSTVDEIAAAVNELLRKIQEEAVVELRR